MSANVEDIGIIRSPVLQTSTAAVAGGYLYGPWTDFALLGGGSIFLLAAIWLAMRGYDTSVTIVITYAIANIINHPHFAHSYQIFYRDFGKKLSTYPRELRIRYFISGIIVPIVLIAFFAATVIGESPLVLGYAVNVMLFAVGWHYAKQGYGMAMVDSVLKKAFFTDEEKKRFLQNAYTTWILSWLTVNYLITNSASDYLGIKYYTFAIPVTVLAISGAAAFFTTLRLAIALWQRRSAGRSIAWNGVAAYCVTLYVWLLFREPILIFWIPIFHSLQYLAVVWRFESNRARSVEHSTRPSLRFGLFIAVGMALGYLGFWVVPQLLDSAVPYSRELFGGSLFLFIFWIFINVHHYFLDSVMWRRGNPDVQAHLFSHQTPG